MEALTEIISDFFNSIGQERTLRHLRSALPPKADQQRRVSACPLCATFGLLHRNKGRHGLHDLLDHLVGGSNREKVPFAWHTLESMHAPVLECDAGADDQVLHGA
jgi:hypothetical protein